MFPLFYVFLTTDYKKLHRDTSIRTWSISFFVERNTALPFYGGRSPPFQSDLSVKNQIGGIRMRESIQKEERTNLIHTEYLNLVENVTYHSMMDRVCCRSLKSVKNCMIHSTILNWKICRI